MTDKHCSGSPQQILLATDLTPACDRAFDRAVQLARMWQAKLTVVHVVETGEREVIGVSRRTSVASAEVHRLLKPYRDQSDLKLSHHLSFGNAAEALLAQAREIKCDFLITGLAYAKTFGEKLIGSTVEQLIREAQVPVLSVRQRTYQPYRSIAVSVDFSEPSRHALDRALGLFPDARFTAVHAYNIGYKGIAPPQSDIGKYEETKQSDVTAMIQSAMDKFLADSGQPRPSMRSHFRHGDPDEVLKAFVEFDDPDLVVIGTHGRTGLRRALIGSVAARLLNTLPCDVLAVHPQA